MTTISHNADTTVYTIRDVSSQIDFFQDVEQTLTIYLEEKADLTYAIFLDSAKIKLTIIAQNPTVKAQIFAFLPSKQASDTSLQVCTKFQSSDTSVRMHLIAIQDDGAKLHMQGEIDIAEGIEKVSGHLLEEVVLLGNAKYTSLQPILNVASPDVQASHGAKVHKIPLEKLFYMQSRGLSSSLALAMIVESYVQQILGHFALSEEEREQVKKFIT